MVDNSPADDKNDVLSAPWRRSLQRSLMGWFRREARDLPWRKTRDLYAIWISEIMLQQTQVATVVPYWQRFLARFPNITQLAAADEHEVLRLWEGLGYYRRARQLHAAARQIATEHGGQFPTTYDAVRSLPGIGRYTAGAILSIGLDRRLPILEANTIRVFSRLTAYRGAPASTTGQKRLWQVAEAVLPAKESGMLNQALMELGSEICTPRSPVCDRCPVAGLCAARRAGLVEQIPQPAARANYESVEEIAVVIRRRGRVLLRKCQPGERWAGLWDYPRFAATLDRGTIEEQISPRIRELVGLDVAAGVRLATLKHGVTRFRITLHCFEAALIQPPGGKQPAARLRSGSADGSSSQSPVRWVAVDQLGDYALSVTGRKLSRLLAEQWDPGRTARR